MHGISPGAYDFVGVAQHEIAEVLGRNTVITSSGGLGFYQNPVDLFRYSAPGVQNYSYTDATYFSLDAGVTNLGWWDNSGGGGDRSDWLTGGGGSYPGDVQNAYLYPGGNVALTGGSGVTRRYRLEWNASDAGRRGNFHWHEPRLRQCPGASFGNGPDRWTDLARAGAPQPQPRQSLAAATPPDYLPWSRFTQPEPDSNRRNG